MKAILPIHPRFTGRSANLSSRGSAIRCSLHGLGIAPNIKESVVKGILLPSPSPRLRMFRANESHADEKIPAFLLLVGVVLTHRACPLSLRSVLSQRDVSRVSIEDFVSLCKKST